MHRGSNRDITEEKEAQIELIRLKGSASHAQGVRHPGAEGVLRGSPFRPTTTRSSGMDCGPCHVRILILETHSSEENRSAILDAGASGFVLKQAAPAELILVIEAEREIKKNLLLKQIVSYIILLLFLPTAFFIWHKITLTMNNSA
jgi:hypothetical protein